MDVPRILEQFGRDILVIAVGAGGAVYGADQVLADLVRRGRDRVWMAEGVPKRDVTHDVGRQEGRFQEVFGGLPIRGQRPGRSGMPSGVFDRGQVRPGMPSGSGGLLIPSRIPLPGQVQPLVDFGEQAVQVIIGVGLGGLQSRQEGHKGVPEAVHGIQGNGPGNVQSADSICVHTLGIRQMASRNLGVFGK